MPVDEPTLLPTEKGTTAVWRGVDLYPSPDPVGYARRKARVFSLSPRSLVYVPSIGLGYGLAELLASLPPGCAVLCVEAHQPLMALAMAQGLPRDQRLMIVRTDDEQAAAGALREMGESRFRRVVEVPLNAGYRLAPAVYAGMRRALEDQLHEYWRNRLTLIALGSLQVRNLFANVPLLARGGDLTSLRTSLPVVVAGAGPSLEEFLPALRAVRSNVILIAVDTALPRLAQESLPPDIVVALEAQLANLQDFLPRLPEAGTLLACELSSLPAVPRLFDGRVHFFSCAFAPLRLFTRMAGAGILPCPFPALGSVGVAALNAALRLTSKQVFLAGLDFSYPGFLTHTRGAPLHLAALAGSFRLDAAEGTSFKAIVERRKKIVPDKTGRPVLTDAILASYRDSLRRIVAYAGGRVYDACASGLDLGAPRVSHRELKEMVNAAGEGGHTLEAGRASVTTVERLRSFIRSELEILDRGEELLRAALGSSTASPDCLRFLDDADYALIHFPDWPRNEAPDRGFLARADVAARYYAERLRRVQSLL
ncbi:MAG TPA: 6-hydroxymethylpterin diphosphokinase MptE-like protein [Spirochaetia bacterium]|nr:6-hydroxymethylpterin diphosphokinase MptE-like protein [Spirochaetia bacterium]